MKVVILFLIWSILKPLTLFAEEETAETQKVQKVEKAPILKDSGRNGGYIDFDAPPAPRNRLIEHLFYGIKLEAKFDHEDNYNLNLSDPDKLSVAEGRAEISFLYSPLDWFHLFTNFSLFHGQPLVDEASQKDGTTKLDVRQAYISFSQRIGQGSGSLRIGRQRIRDEREWYFDDNLDGFRLLFGDRQYYFHASVTRRRFVDQDLLRDEKNPETNNFFLTLGYRPLDSLRLEGFALYRDDLTNDEGQPIFLGTRVLGNAFSGLKYWTDFAYVFGKSDEVRKRINGKRINTNDNLSGFGFDIGASYILDVPLKPYFTLGYAFGTGDDNPDDDTDHTFRQTGLQDNSGRFHGRAKFKYYGEVFDPELSNMSIFTAALGVKPTRKSSIDLVYHYFRQDKAVDEIRDTDIEADPDGINKNLGQEIDLIIGSRDFKNLSLEFNFGYFWPGNAFAENRDNAFLTNLKASYKF